MSYRVDVKIIEEDENDVYEGWVSPLMFSWDFETEDKAEEFAREIADWVAEKNLKKAKNNP